LKLLFDLYSTQANAITKFHGGGVYGQAFFSELAAIDFFRRSGTELTVALRSGAPVPKDLEAALSATGARRLRVQSHRELASEAVGGGYDVFYTPVPYWLSGYADLFARSADAGPPLVKGTVHGLRTLDAPEDAYGLRYQRNIVKRTYRRLLRLSAARYASREKRSLEAMLRCLNGGMLTVSLHSKYQLVTEFPFLSPETIEVISSIDAPAAPDAAPRGENPAGLPQHLTEALSGRPYFLSLNANRPSKNVLRVVEALDAYRPPALEPFAYLCIGFTQAQKGFISRRYRWASRLIVHLPYVERKLLDALYANAYALLFPSVSEGFGYPPLEAMRVGVPALCSASTAIPETCGKAALYFQPRIHSEIVNRMVQLVSEPGLRERLVEAGYARYAAYSARRPQLVERFGAFLLSGASEGRP
jgi:glycosyltransferase involved in cell wall biosynthesis